MFRHWIRAAASLGLLLWLAACTTTPIESSVDYDQAYDFSRVKAIALQPVDRAALSSGVSRGS